MTPNLAMLQFMLAVRERDRNGGHLASYTDLDPEESAIALAVGIENGWLTASCALTDAGLHLLRGDRQTAYVPVKARGEPRRIAEFGSLYRTRHGISRTLYADLKRVMPPLMLAALEELHATDGRLEEFETRHDLPARSARAILRLSLDTYTMLMGAIL